VAVRYRVLGAVELVDLDGRSCPIGSANQRALLAVLLAAHGQVVTSDALADALWGDDAPPTALATLRTYVSRLRRIGVELTSRGGGYALQVDADDLDSDRFESLVDAARRAEVVNAADLLAAALDQWAGTAYGDCADLDLVRAEARRLEERRLAAREAHAAALLAAHRTADAVASAEAFVTAEPLREGGWAVLIEALAEANRTADALRAYRRAATALGEAGLEPSRRLRDAEQAALRVDRDWSWRTPDANRPSGRAHRFPLPVPSSSFLGRDEDTKLIDELLTATTRLVTLTGPGGVGKTRLAIEVARRAAERIELGACVVELASITDPANVPDLVVATLGLTADGRPAVDIVPMIGSLDVLIVLDNAEHVIDAAAATVEQILSSGPTVRVLATSREPLSLDGEHVWTVAPLAAAGADAPAIDLFRQRATAFGGDVDDATVTRIVRRLDGLPLAIEMAAAQLDTTTASELADALDGGGDGALRSRRRDRPERHRSLTDLLAWSESRLTETEARTFAALSVFSGPVGTVDIEAVLDDPDAVDVVRTLARRSLVSVDRDRASTRFSLLETVRSYARRRLASTGRAEEISRRHADWFVEVARSADAQLRTDREALAHARIESLFAELRAAHRWAMEHDPELATEIPASLYVYAHASFVDEPLLWAQQLLERIRADHPRVPILLGCAARRLMRRGKITEARRLALEAADLAGDRASALPALGVLSDAALSDGRTQEGIQAARRMIELAARDGDAHFFAIAHVDLALCTAYGRHHDPAADARLREVRDQSHSPSIRGWLSYARGELRQRDDTRQALAHFDDAIADARAANDRYLEGVAMVSSCSLHARTGKPSDALAVFADAIRHWNRVGNTPGQVTTLRNLAILFQRLDAPRAFAEVVGAVDAHTESPTYGEEADRLETARIWAKDRLGDDRFDELIAVGASRSINTAANAALDATVSLLPGTSGQPDDLVNHP
jgi:predicted ATPase/DNA-binding SARP family transcriptional activator